MLRWYMETRKQAWETYDPETLWYFNCTKQSTLFLFFFFSLVTFDNFSNKTERPALLQLFSYAFAKFSLIISPILSSSVIAPPV